MLKGSSKDEIDHNQWLPQYSPEKANHYERKHKIGAGAFGEINMLHDRISGKMMAGKSIRLTGGSSYGREGEGELPQPIFRELHALRILSGKPNIISLIDYFPIDSELVLVFEYMASDLELVIDKAIMPLPERVVKCFLLMLLNGLSHIHSMGLLHRDIKPANCLISSQGELKIADFGLARPNNARLMNDKQQSNNNDSTSGKMSHQIATRWYRAPEILFGAKTYDIGVDIWGAGTIFYELLTLNPMCPGLSDIDQLFRVLQIRGTPTQENWPGAFSLPDYSKISFPPMEPVPLSMLLPNASASAVKMAESLLSLDPNRRPSAHGAISDIYFSESPLPSINASKDMLDYSLIPLRDLTGSQSKSKVTRNKPDILDL